MPSRGMTTPLPTRAPVTHSVPPWRRLLHRMMFMPGRILHCVKVDVALVDPSHVCLRTLFGLCGRAVPAAIARFVSLLFRCCCCVRARRVYAPRWADRHYFTRLQVSVDMLADHMPDKVASVLQTARADAAAAHRSGGTLGGARRTAGIASEEGWQEAVAWGAEDVAL